MIELKDTISGMISTDYRERFRAEYAQTLVRYRKLNVIVNSYDEGELDFAPVCPFSLLSEQRYVMTKYLEILERRAKFEGIDLMDIQR